MNPWDIAAVALLTLLGFVLGGGVAMVIFVRRQLRSRCKYSYVESEPLVIGREVYRYSVVPYNPLQARRPNRWLAIRSRDTLAVQAELGLRDARPCSWSEGVFASQKLFVSPPVNGWTLVFGDALPNPDEDVDVSFRFLRELSSRLGHVQFFQADPLLQHHAWAQLELGRVLRAYAWAGTTIWNQGVKTNDEIAIGMNCFGYGENPGSDDWVVADHIVANVERVYQLAHRWSLDPGEIDLRVVGGQRGLVGNITRKL